MNRYEKENAARRIAGYYFPMPHEDVLGKHAEAFERAKAETLKQMRAAVAQTEALTADDFFAERRRGIKVPNVVDSSSDAK